MNDEDMDDPAADGYRWDLHYRRTGNAHKGRCEAMTERSDGSRVRCEFIPHLGKQHASLDGSIQWTEREGADT